MVNTTEQKLGGAAYTSAHARRTVCNNYSYISGGTERRTFFTRTCLRMGLYLWLFFFVVKLSCLAQNEQLEIGIVSGFSSTLRYLNGSCSWRVATILAGNPVDQPLSVGPQITLFGEDDNSDGFTLRCVTEEGKKLSAIIITYAQDTIPPPSNITLDYEVGILHWSHPFHPELPDDFEIIHEHSVSYSVTVVHSKSGESGETMMSSVTTLSISQLLDNCRRQQFTLQTVVNDQYFSQPESFVHDPNISVVPHFIHLSAMFEYSLMVQVEFHLGAQACLSQFTIVIYGVANLSFNVTRAEAAKGTVLYNLDPEIISPVDICDVKSVIYGGNEIGSSTPYNIHLPNVYCVSTSVSTTGERPRSSSVPPTIQQTKESGVRPEVVGSVAAAVLVVLSLAILLVVSFLTIRHRKKRDKLHPALSSDECSNGPTSPTAVSPRSTRLHYSDVESRTGAREIKRLSMEHTSEYADIDHVETERARKQHVQTEAAKKFGNDEAAPVQSSIDPGIVGLSHASHYDLLLSVLLLIKARWFDLGMNLKLSENFLDETETNMETEEECLGEVLQNWLLYHNPTLETLNNALSQMNASPIAFDAASGEFVSISG